MTITLTIGWWLVPAAVTLIAFAWAIPLRRDERPTGSMFDGLALIAPLIRCLGAASVSLAAWLIWSLIG